eukprot:7145836-Pyramimonas_sp.AAC.1
MKKARAFYARFSRGTCNPLPRRANQTLRAPQECPKTNQTSVVVAVSVVIVVVVVVVVLLFLVAFVSTARRNRPHAYSFCSRHLAL